LFSGWIFYRLKKEDSPQKQSAVHPSSVPEAENPTALEAPPGTVLINLETGKVVAPSPKRKLPTQMNWSDAQTFLTERGRRVTSGAAPNTLRGESPAELIVFEFDVPNSQNPTKCISIFWIEKANWRAALTEFGGVSIADASRIRRPKGPKEEVNSVRVASGSLLIVTDPDEVMVSLGTDCSLDDAKMAGPEASNRKSRGKGKPDAKELAERTEAEAAALDDMCGSRPNPSLYDGMPLAVNRYMHDNLNDASSYEGLGCTEPVLTKKSCWVVTCKFRAANELGAKTVQTKRFSIGRHPTIEGFGKVIGVLD